MEPLYGLFPLQPLSFHEGPVTPGVRSVCMNGKSVGGALEFVEHTQTILALNEDVSQSNIRSELFVSSGEEMEFLHFSHRSIYQSHKGAPTSYNSCSMLK